ncbi:hypothetical protein O7632_12710 [Solwaraspora sp. WMMD406]|uniref:hypothetical protein n=1 Tax=Solwaraspora sp. WMMD406 TaxID=3016095 RepID=UPI002415E41D|nr:hypothetical protein [Solwaraspora sp. WMMD406]MDG4764952.1 hypothetical protein [Solwaraspora sp. WMMD406]
MQLPRFVFLATTPTANEAGRPADQGILWTLVSPNNRPLARAPQAFASYAECQEAVRLLQSAADQLRLVETTAERTGQWTWRAELDGRVLAVSSRSYLRTRECAYNIGRFREALPVALIVAGTRAARREPRPPAAESPSPRALAAAPVPAPARTGESRTAPRRPVWSVG